MADVPALYYAQNVGIEVLAGADPVAYAALNIGVEPQTGTDPVAYAALNIGDWAVGNIDDTLGPEFTFAPILNSLVPDFGRVGQQVIAYGVGFGDEKTFVRWGKTGTAGGVTGGTPRLARERLTAPSHRGRSRPGSARSSRDRTTRRRR